MKALTVIIERSSDSFSGYALNIDGIYAQADTVEEVKNQILESIEITKEISPNKIPKEYDINFRMDVASLLSYYKGILTNSGLEKLTGINQKQFNHYASGIRNPKPEQRHKIEESLHKFAKELLQIDL